MSRLLLLITIVISFGSCKKDPVTDPATTNNTSTNNTNNNNAGSNQVLTSISISDAISLVITENNGVTNLLKTTNANAVEEVLYLDQSGDPMVDDPDIAHVYDLNSQYLIMTFNYVEDVGYLVRKTDGVVFDMAAAGGIPFFVFSGGQWGGPVNRPRIQSDANGYIYYISGYDAPIIKADISNPSAITGAVYTYADDQVRNFVVTPNGDVAYQSWGTLTGARIKKVAGGYHSIPNDNFWVDLSGNINHAPDLYWDTQTQSNVFDVHNLAVNPTSGVVTETVTDVGIQVRTNYGPAYEFVFSDKVISANTNSITNGFIEVDNVSGQVSLVTSYTIAGSLEYGDASNDYIYILTQNGGDKVLTKINKDSYAAQVLVAMNTDGYDIYEYSVDDANVLTFYALRTSDGARVLGEINAAGTISILSATIANAVNQVQRIN
ncbi:MAG: hypothetical protein ACI9CO_002177 [Candidatus Azotimanducaceae bacterium]|jgi:hypothetical protein